MCFFVRRLSVLRLILVLSILISFNSNALDEPSVIQEKSFERPLREVSLIYTPEGYYPENISVFAGEKVRLFVTATTKQPGCLLIPQKEIFLSAQKGEVSEADLYFDRPGEFKFYCPNGKVFGKLTVLERPEVARARRQREVSRDIASKRSKVKLWKPREE